MNGALYEVTGDRRFRGHDHGELFEANLDRAAERRAVARGDIRVIERVTPSIDAAMLDMPSGWLKQQKEE